MELPFSTTLQNCEKKKFTEILSGPLPAGGAKASVKLPLIRLKLSVEIMECQAASCVGAVSGQGLFLGH